MTNLRVPRIAALTVAAILSISLQARAQGGFNGPGRYEIANVRSGKVIDLDRNNQTGVIQFASRGTDNQQWDVLPAEPGFWFLRNAMNGAALEAMDQRNSTQVRGMPFTGGPTQQWRIVPAPDGNAMITNRLGKTLDIPNGALRDGTQINTYDPNGEDNQRFVFRRLAELARGDDRRNFDRDGDRDDDWDHDHRWSRYYGRFDDREHRWGMEGDGVCFYRQEGFRGRSFCVPAGDELRRMPEGLSEHFRSMKIFGRVRGVEIFTEEQFGGRRIRFQHDQPELHDVRRIYSVRVY